LQRIIPFRRKVKMVEIAPPRETKGKLSMSLDSLGLLTSGSASGAALANPAIARCSDAWISRYQAEMSKSKDDVLSAHRADASYRDAMPPLLDYEGIRDFIACTAHGMLIGAIPPQDGARLLYAAQVALATLHCQPRELRPPGRPKCLPNN
jgi:hypothetical protein